MPKTLTKSTDTDWARVKREAAQDTPMAHTANDSPYTPTMPLPCPPTGKPPLSPVAVKRPTLNMRVDAEVLAAFKATGAGWQTRINAVLRDAVAHGVARTDPDKTAHA